MYTYPLFFRVFSHIGHYRVLSRVPRAIQKVLIVTYIIHSIAYVSIPVSPYPSPLPAFSPGNHKFVFYICDSISVLQISSFAPFIAEHRIIDAFELWCWKDS